MAYYGGNYGNGANAGLFNLNVNNAASNSNSNIGGRLANDSRQKAPGQLGQRPVRILWGHCPDHAVEDKQDAAASSPGGRGSIRQSTRRQCQKQQTAYGAK